MGYFGLVYHIQNLRKNMTTIGREKKASASVSRLSSLFTYLVSIKL
jgi:hypothetical protein